ncbi:MAG: hypothetical protein GWN18_04310 [Thermoplasmata archaeon]|nr:hypothetical protein [Thermoplasmata archaeon]NIS11259.1 hypothetical protein [Thermoplasmata archaeon]NIS19193.1 hypothetical protein [Thermoplasmata archaeon]NIT76247.1 hypothetical protein [Thermoplasmata archaeon]NIU48328.1 hypothetical protein [Thermoplasmata archaeon]
MAKRRRRLKPGGPRRQYTSTAQVRMLDIRKKKEFKYHMNRILDKSDMREDVRQTFMANVLSKSSQQSIESAKDYISDMVAEEHLEQDVANRLFKLLDEHSMRR